MGVGWARFCSGSCKRIVATLVHSPRAVMATDGNAQTAQIIALQPKAAQRASEKKWGKPVLDLGFSIIPSLIFRAQQRLGLNPTQLAVLLQIADFWWEQSRKPYPSMKTLGERLNLSPRQVQRYVGELEKAGLVQRVKRWSKYKGRLSNEYDLTGLVNRLKKIAPEFREVKEMEHKVFKKGGLMKKKPPGKE